jgi:hypothetical protein
MWEGQFVDLTVLKPTKEISDSLGVAAICMSMKVNFAFLRPKHQLP